MHLGVCSSNFLGNRPGWVGDIWEMVDPVALSHGTMPDLLERSVALRAAKVELLEAHLVTVQVCVRQGVALCEACEHGVGERFWVEGLHSSTKYHTPLLRELQILVSVIFGLGVRNLQHVETHNCCTRAYSGIWALHRFVPMRLCAERPTCTTRTHASG